MATTQNPGPENEHLPQELRNEIRRQAVQQVAKTTIAFVAAAVIIAGTGWVLWVKDRLPGIVGGVPNGVVAAFDLSTGCPDGWTEFADASGRFIVGSGQGTNLTQRPLRAIGGLESHKLTRDQVPPLLVTIPWVGASRSDRLNAGGRDYPVLGLSDREVDFGGAAEAFSLMPPFISLLYCKKV